MVLADWFSRLGTEAGFKFEQHGRSGNAFIIGAPTGLHVTAPYADLPPYLKFVASDPGAQAAIDDLATKAVERVARRDFGGPVWYSTQIADPGLKLSASFMGNFLERLGNQTRLTGWRRLGRDVLLEFREAPSTSSDHLIAPKAEVKVHIAAPGPQAGHFASHIAHGVLETVASICAFALGRSVQLPQTVFSAKPETVAELSEKHTDTSVLTLARKSVSLALVALHRIRTTQEDAQQARRNRALDSEHETVIGAGAAPKRRTRTFIDAATPIRNKHGLAKSVRF